MNAKQELDVDVIYSEGEMSYVKCSSEAANEAISIPMPIPKCCYAEMKFESWENII